MAKSYSKRSHSKTTRKHKGRKGSKSGKRSTKRRSRRGGLLSWADMKAKASAASNSLKQNMKDGAATANTHYENAKAHTSAKLANSPT